MVNKAYQYAVDAVRSFPVKANERFSKFRKQPEAAKSHHLTQNGLWHLYCTL